jgi:hypothetical protein
MRWLACALGVAIVLVGIHPDAQAQKSTEQYIPIGSSPGLSKKYTSIGTIETLNARDGLFTISEAGVRRSIRITAKTRIWLDRSKLKLPSLDGGTGDLQPGRRIEVKYENPVLRQVADWIKVEAPSP